MRTLVLGGIRSGKSRWAETAIAENLAVGTPVCYLATGAVTTTDAAWQHRIATHRDRRPPWWHTVETLDIAAQLRANPGTPTLIDDIGGWLAAMLDRRGWDTGSVESETDDLVAALGEVRADVVLVSPEVGLTVVPATASGRLFADALGTLNQRLADRCERVVLVIAGQPVLVKSAAAVSG